MSRAGNFVKRAFVTARAILAVCGILLQTAYICNCNIDGSSGDKAGMVEMSFTTCLALLTSAWLNATGLGDRSSGALTPIHEGMN